MTPTAPRAVRARAVRARATAGAVVRGGTSGGRCGGVRPLPLAPPGDPARPRGAARAPSFVIQEHHARRLHWDFRLEHDGVLVSWALPKGEPTDPARNHLAVQTEDHPLAYGTFEGRIPAGEYGAGEVTLWDTGTYEPEKWRDGREVIVTLHGDRRGTRRLALIRTGTGTHWLIHRTQQQPAPPPGSPRHFVVGSCPRAHEPTTKCRPAKPPAPCRRGWSPCWRPAPGPLRCGGWRRTRSCPSRGGPSR
ncbi:DNA polymerase ligase N-terminal domain-containing protein [Xylanimonas allomyrinae]|uniref:DNA polymerase ligase N-terminal domain-containing protein n=1 Tax=Xylanimonas allomyrinae TaxID=2509459 RepID=UPI001FE4785F|nr:DNA polymerase ligase N-terminal domain-containing protein [Xylanimonas allomyrinae]